MLIAFHFPARLMEDFINGETQTRSLTKVYIEILMRNGCTCPLITSCRFSAYSRLTQLPHPPGLWVKTRFEFKSADIENCLVTDFEPGQGGEMNHRCSARRKLYEDIAGYAPGLVQGQDFSWFRTINQADYLNRTCLFQGCKLELCLLPVTTPEFGLCFTRTSFVKERERLDLDLLLKTDESGDLRGWTRREPSDTDRLRVNKRGREVLYFVRPPDTFTDLTPGDLRAEILYSLQVEDPKKISFASGPFFWGSDFKDDESGLLSNYFGADIVIDSRHMKSLRGAALIDVVENLT